MGTMHHTKLQINGPSGSDNEDDNDNVSPVGARGHIQALVGGGAPAWSCGDTHYWESGHNAPQAGQQQSPRPGGTLSMVSAHNFKRG